MFPLFLLIRHEIRDLCQKVNPRHFSVHQESLALGKILKVSIELNSVFSDVADLHSGPSTLSLWTHSKQFADPGCEQH